MTQEEKLLLLKDLCARLPYKVKCPFNCKKGVVTAQITEIDLNQGIISYIPDGSSITYCSLIYSDTFDLKLYLRPISSMTEEEKILMSSICLKHANGDVEEMVSEFSEFYNSRHLDYHGLIGMGLALEAKEGMYKTE